MTNPTQGIDYKAEVLKSHPNAYVHVWSEDRNGAYGVIIRKGHAQAISDDCKTEAEAWKSAHSRLQPSRAASEPATKDKLMWSRPEPNWRKDDIAGCRLLSDGRREFLMHNEALCWPYYVAIDGEYVAASPSPKEPQPEGIGWPVGWCSSCDRMTSAGTVGDGKPCCDKCGDWLIFAGPNDDEEEQVVPTDSQPPSPEPQAVDDHEPEYYDFISKCTSQYDSTCRELAKDCLKFLSALTEARQRIAQLEHRCNVFAKGLDNEEKDCSALHDELAEARRENERLASAKHTYDVNLATLQNNHRIENDEHEQEMRTMGAELTRLREQRNQADPQEGK